MYFRQVEFRFFLLTVIYLFLTVSVNYSFIMEFHFRKKSIWTK